MIWDSAGLSGVAFVDAEKFYKIYSTLQ